MIDATVLVTTAAYLAFLHTLVGVDHSLPFVVLGKARGWSLRRTLLITGACGAGHVASSVAIGAAGIAIGLSLEPLVRLESARGSLSAWLLIGFGLAYASWSFHRTLRRRQHVHVHSHPDGTVHRHVHDHLEDHIHVHDQVAIRERGAVDTGQRRLTPWILFLIFSFGPCEALIPLMMAPAVNGAWLTVAAVVAVFAAITLMTMLATVATGYFGVGQRRFALVDRHAGSLAGLAVAASGLAVMVLGV